LSNLDNLHTRRAYERHLSEFFTWHRQTGERAISKELVQRYAAHLQSSKVSPATLNQKLSAIRTLAVCAAEIGALDPHVADGIKAVRGVKRTSASDRSSGHPLTKQAAQKLLNTPDTATLKGLRDRAILALMIGCGLRRAEVVDLTFADIQRRGKRWAIVNVGDSRSSERSVPLPTWTKQAIDTYKTAAGITSGIVFRPINRSGNLSGDRMTEQAIYNLVAEYANLAGLGSVAPNDLRLTFATLAHKGGATVDQIQHALGHSSIDATQRYLNIEQDLTDVPGDHLGLKLAK
jgi:site-specific recombinase XerD